MRQKIFAQNVSAKNSCRSHGFKTYFLAYQNENLTLEIHNLSQWIDIFNKKQIANNFAYFTYVVFG